MKSCPNCGEPILLNCRSRKGAWIEIFLLITCLVPPRVAPVRERGLKYRAKSTSLTIRSVAPVRERGLKYQVKLEDRMDAEVAPVRERGLKS